MTREVKLLLTGIQAAGKTSILRVLDNDFVTLHQLRPTTGVERSMVEVLGMTFVRWDLGGQQTYRDRYLADMEKYFGGLNLLVYVVDIQDEQYVEETINYLENVLDFVKTQEVKPYVAVFFHKFDPDVFTDAGLNTRMREYIERVDRLRGDLKVDYYPTSIYDRDTLTMVFSQVILQAYPRRELIRDELEAVKGELSSPILSVADSTPFVLGHVVEDDFPEMFQKRFNHLLITNINLLRHKLEMPNFQLDLFDPNRSVFLAPFQIKETYYFLAGLLDKGMLSESGDLGRFKQKVAESTARVSKVLSLFYG
ncbi:MAG: ADP-ribosylation factor-like protein [Promethearchaeota archaeon]